MIWAFFSQETGRRLSGGGFDPNSVGEVISRNVCLLLACWSRWLRPGVGYGVPFLEHVIGDRRREREAAEVKTGRAPSLVTSHPLGGGPLPGVTGVRRASAPKCVLHHFGQLISTQNGHSGILVKVRLIAPRTPIRRRASFSQSDRMDNLLEVLS